jgi:hypothetical protein
MKYLNREQISPDVEYEKNGEFPSVNSSSFSQRQTCGSDVHISSSKKTRGKFTLMEKERKKI